MADVAARLARWRVPLGFVSGGLVLWLAQPTWATIVAGGLVAVVGQAIRIWSAGHLEKSREVTRSGPSRWARHPLYVGSSVMGLGTAIASASGVAACVTTIYLVVTLTAAIRTEEAFLRTRFGPEYDAYCRGQAPAVERRFSWDRAWRNREWRAVLGLAIALTVLLIKGWYAVRGA
jgi:protein-S-isoprenylcysteine O-methyltransferase Ste14